MQQTFTDFKNNFYNKVEDITLFDCGDINLLKVVLDGLKVKYTSKGKVNSYLFYPLWLYNLYCFIKRKKRKNTFFDIVNPSNASLFPYTTFIINHIVIISTMMGASVMFAMYAKLSKWNKNKEIKILKLYLDYY